MSAAIIQIQWQRTASPLRMSFVLALALVLHLAVVVWWNIKQPPELIAAAPIKLVLVPAPAVIEPPEIEVLESAPPELEEAAQDKLASPRVAKAAPRPVLQAHPAQPQPAQPAQPRAAALLRSLRKYNLDEDRLYPVEPSKPRIRVLGDPPPGDVMLALQDHLPELPFGSSGMELAFYSSGFRGDLERFGDAITQEFGFKTRYGTRVKCVAMVVLVVCGWD